MAYQWLSNGYNPGKKAGLGLNVDLVEMDDYRLKLVYWTSAILK
jgi:hypothetical protein